MNKINYDFTNILEAINSIKNKGTASSADLGILKTEINAFFKDSSCKEIIFTNNTDKMFFGIKTVSMINAENIYDYLVGNEDVRIDSFLMEIDSKLFDPIMNLSSRELLAIIVYETSKLTRDASPIENARNALNVYLASNRDYIRISQSIHYKEILAYGLKDFISKSESMFYNSDKTDIFSDEFMCIYGLDDDVASAYDKISRNNMKMYENTEISKFIVFSWTLSLYRNLRIRRIGAIKTLSRAKLLTGSRLEQMEINNVITRINQIDNVAIMESYNSTNSKDKRKEKNKARMKKARIKDLSTINNEFYELNMRINNVEDEDEALYILRQLNNCISIIDEYIELSDCDEYERKQWFTAKEKFEALREKLSGTIVYKNKNYGLFVTYPDIVENRY